MNDRMKDHKLRFVWLVVCVVIGLLLMLLTVRSYYRVDAISGDVGGLIGFKVQSAGGWLYIHHNPKSAWGFSSSTFGEWTNREETLHQFRASLGAPRNKSVMPPAYIAAPAWLVALLVMSMGGLPWLPWPKHFSLRALLLVVTIVAVLAGAFTYLARG